MVDRSGQPSTLQERRGKVVLLTFTYNICVEVRPPLTAAKVTLQQPLTAAELGVLAAEHVAMNSRPEILSIAADSLADEALADLCDLVIDAVSAGASVGWVSVPTTADVTAYWRAVARQVKAGTVVLLVARSSGRLIGTVQLHLSARENGAHRGEVARLLVHTQARRQGVGMTLMAAVEAEAWRRGLSLLILDTRTGDPSQLLYEKRGWTLAGVIPQYARGTTGVLQSTSIMYKLARQGG